MINNFDTCLKSVDEKHFFIKDGDDQKPAFIVQHNGEFEVVNNTDNPISFLKIDSCVFDSSDDKRCDCAVYNDDVFCFIELKCIKSSNFSTNRKNAESQLEETIKHFHDENILKNKTLEAYVSLNCQPKIDENFEPITQRPRSNEQATNFMLKLNTNLYYGTKKEFN